MTVLCGHVFHLRCMKSLCDGTDHKNVYHVKCPVCAFDPTAVVDSGGGLACWKSSMGTMLAQHFQAPCASARTRKLVGTVIDGSDEEEGWPLASEDEGGTATPNANSKALDVGSSGEGESGLGGIANATAPETGKAEGAKAEAVGAAAGSAGGARKPAEKSKGKAKAKAEAVGAARGSEDDDVKAEAGGAAGPAKPTSKAEAPMAVDSDSSSLALLTDDDRAKVLQMMPC